MTVSQAAASLKHALEYNSLELRDLVWMDEDEALRLPFIGRKVLKEAQRQYFEKFCCTAVGPQMIIPQ